ncbi:MAG: hypothetical protein AAF685_02010 [Cyanobacteria bacterium P01_C01_bin.89]
MNIVQSVQGATRYLLEATARLFSPSDDNYPATGMQPFSGDPNHKSQRDLNWND